MNATAFGFSEECKGTKQEKKHTSPAGCRRQSALPARVTGTATQPFFTRQGKTRILTCLAQMQGTGNRLLHERLYITYYFYLI
jgi:hypothetical protein